MIPKFYGTAGPKHIIRKTEVAIISAAVFLLKIAMDAPMAQKTWELTNNVEAVGTVDDIYRYDKKQHQDILTAKPWEKE